MEMSSASSLLTHTGHFLHKYHLPSLYQPPLPPPHSAKRRHPFLAMSIATTTSPISLIPESITVPKRLASTIVEETSPIPEKTLHDEIENARAYWDYQFLFRSQRQEAIHPIDLEVVEGCLPLDLHGCYYLCGPGILSDDHGSSVHPLDGHGYLRKFDISSTSVKYSARYINTEAREEEYDPEKDSWRFTYRGPFSMLKGGNRFGNFKVMKNVANTSVLKWAGRLICLWEGGEPYEINPESLNTVGLLRVTGNEKAQKHEVEAKASSNAWEWKLSSVANTLKKELVVGALMRGAVAVTAKILLPILSGIFSMPGERMLSHFKFDVKRQRFVVLTCRAEDMLLPKSNFTAYEFDSSMNLLNRKQFIIHEHLMIHDWGLTDNHYILVGNRIKLDYLGSMAAVAGMSPMISALTLDNSLPYTPMYLLPRFSKAKQKQRNWRIPVKLPEPFWLLHVANAYEEESPNKEGQIHVVLQGNVCSYNWFSLQNMFGYSWQQKRLNPAVMNNEETSTTSTGELGAPHIVEMSCTVRSDEDEPVEVPKVRRSKSWKKACDFPGINPNVSGSPNKYTYVAASSGMRKTLRHFPFDLIAKLDNSKNTCSTWWAGERCFVGEPMFVPRTSTFSHHEEDDGYVLFVQYDVATQFCYLVILDAQKMGTKKEVVARIRVPKELTFPIGFHGFWEDTIETKKEHSPEKTFNKFIKQLQSNKASLNLVA